MTITVDRRIYSDKCISDVVYWLSYCYTLERTIDGDFEKITVTSDGGEKFRTEFFRRLNDCKLRSIIETETKDIRTILYAKAFGDFDCLTAEEATE
ncbi:MAG: His-Xaa-Ser system protein HxsD [Bacteroidales bacterium]|nr:His-Xaa-Ser system protein HxsD [Bacteroidales bacterium]